MKLINCVEWFSKMTKKIFIGLKKNNNIQRKKNGMNDLINIFFFDQIRFNNANAQIQY